MKLSRATWLLIGAGVLIIISAGLGMVRSQQIDEQNELKEKLAPAKLSLAQESTRIKNLSSRKAELEGQLSQATSRLETVNATLSQPVGSIDISNTLFDIAEAYGLEVTEVTSLGLVSDRLEGITCSVLPLTVRVQGDLPSLINLVTELNNSLETGIVDSVEITIPETTSGDNTSASIRLAVYTYQGG